MGVIDGVGVSEGVGVSVWVGVRVAVGVGVTVGVGVKVEVIVAVWVKVAVAGTEVGVMVGAGGAAVAHPAKTMSEKIANGRIAFMENLRVYRPLEHKGKHCIHSTYRKAIIG